MTEAPPSSFAALRLDRLRKLQELRAERDKLIAQDPGGARHGLIEQYPTALDFAERFDMRTRRTPALELLARRLRETVDTKDGRLAVSIPPQEGKSTLLKWLIVWLLVQNPDRRIVFASFAQSLARRTGREVRNLLQSHPELALPLDQSHRDATDWGIAGKIGGLYSVGVGGALTGRSADVMIIDDPLRGQSDADSDITRTNLHEWWESTSRTRLGTGAPALVVQCMTGDTPVLMGDGLERPLRDVRPGDVVATYDNGEVTGSTVRAWANQGPDSIYAIKMKSGRVVRANARHPFLTIEDGELAWQRTDTLKPGTDILTVTGGSGAASPAPATAVKPKLAVRAYACPATARSAGQTATDPHPSIRSVNVLGTSSIVMASLPTNSMRCLNNSADSALSVVSRPRVGTPELTGTASFASTTITRPAEFVACCATTAISRSGTASRRPCSVQPLTTYRPEPDQVVEVVPCGVEDVFDLQIDRTENFIANVLISHNTRWHEDDLAGRLVGQGWPLVNIPALADGRTEDALHREPGEWLVSARGRTPSDWEATRRDVGERTFAALYQGRPAPLEGGIFQREWFNTHRLTQRPELDPVAIGVDPADTGKGDAAGILVAGVTPGGQIVFVADESGQLSQAQWARKACLAWIRHGASRIVQEHNLGMRTSIPDAWALLYRQATALDAAEDTRDGLARSWSATKALEEAGDTTAAKQKELHQLAATELYREILDAGPTGPRVVSITPRQSKRVRAESVAGAFETGRACILGELKALEYEAATWVEGQKSPNRIDTLAMLTMHLESVRGTARIGRAKAGGGEGGAVIPINTAKGRAGSGAARGVTPMGMRRAMRGLPQSPHERDA